jgi:hypothetical protein
MTTPDTEELETALRRWAFSRGSNIEAAIELLIDHDNWLSRPYFVATVVTYDHKEGMASIRWAEVQKFLNQGALGSGIEVSVLRFALDLAQDRYGWSELGESHRHRVGRAVDRALHRGAQL